MPLRNIGAVLFLPTKGVGPHNWQACGPMNKKMLWKLWRVISMKRSNFILKYMSKFVNFNFDKSLHFAGKKYDLS